MEDVVCEAREEFAVDVVGAVFVLFEEVDLRGDGAGVALVDDALDEEEREIVQGVEMRLDCVGG